MEFRVLGPVEVAANGQLLGVDSPKQRSLLAFLLIHVGEVQSTDRIIDAIWGEEPPEGGVKTLRYHISKLRDALGAHAGVIETRSPGYVLAVDSKSVDASHFERLAAEGLGLLRSDPQQASTLLGEALGLWRGRAFSDFQYEDFVQAEARRLDEMRLAALEDRIRADLAAGEGRMVIGELEGLVEEHPLRERLRALLMVALYRTGRQADALTEYDRLRKQLVVQLGLDPSPQLQALEQQILEQDPALTSGDPLDEAESPTRTQMRNPYKGLRPFGEADAADFYGRVDLVERMLERLQDPGIAGRFLVLTGPSGSGKSSVLRAGLIPALRNGAIDGSAEWTLLDMFPGHDPLTRLTDRLESAVGDTLLLIDQFEELFVLSDVETQVRFLNRLEQVVAGNQPIRIVATLRADLLVEPLQHPRFARLVDAGLVLVTPLVDDEVRAAVINPAASSGVRVEPELVARIITDVASRPATLPLLQYALTDLFDHRRTNELTLAEYRAAGSISGALARRADQIYSELKPTQREAARQVFLRLVTVTPDAEHLRRRVPRIELDDLPIDQNALDAILDRFGRQRLLTFDRDDDTGEATVEVAHEALLREWPRLWDWVEINRHDIRTHRRLAAAVTEWTETDHDPAFLPTGNRLTLLRAFAHDTTLALTSGEQAYLDAATHRAEQQRRLRSRRRRTIAIALAGAALIAAVFAVVALVQRNRANDEAANAQRQVRITTARELAGAARANLTTDAELGVLLALEAVDVTQAAGEPAVGEAIGSLHQAILASSWSDTWPAGAGPTWSPDGSRLAAFKPGSLDTIVVLDAADGEPIHELTGLEDATGLAWSPDAQVIVTTDFLGPTILWDAATGKPLPPLADAMTGQMVPTFSRDGTLLAARGVTEDPSSVTVVETATGEEVAHLLYEWPISLALSFSPHADVLAVGVWNEQDPEQDYIELRSGPEYGVARNIGPHPRVLHAVFSPDGTRLASVSQLGGIRIWSVETGEEVQRIDTAASARPAWSPDGLALAVGMGSSVEIWSAATGTLEDTLYGHSSDVLGVSFNPDGATLATGDFNKTRLWNVDALRGEIVTFAGAWFGATWLPDSSGVIASTPDGTLRVLDTANGVARASHRGEPEHTTPRVIASADGRLVARANTGGAIVLDAGTLEQVASPEPRLPLAFSPDVDLLAVADLGDEFAVRIYETETWHEVVSFDYGAYWATFLPEGRHLLLSAENAPGQGVLWDLEAGAEVARLPLPDQGQGGGVSATADGALIAVGEFQTGEISVWDADALLAGATSEEALVRTFHGPPSLSGVILSPDGEHLFAAGGSTVAVFDVDTGENFYQFDLGATAGEFSLSHDGRYLAIPTSDGLHVITTDLDQLIAIAKERAGRALTDVECQTYLHVDECPAE